MSATTIAQRLDALHECMEQVQADAENDVQRWDGAAVTGHNIAAMHGETMAMLMAVAWHVDQLAVIIRHHIPEAAS